jgi:hypothetical protein
MININSIFQYIIIIIIIQTFLIRFLPSLGNSKAMIDPCILMFGFAVVLRHPKSF